MAAKQFEHLQELSLTRLRALVPSGCPLLVARRTEGGFIVTVWDGRDFHVGRYQVVAAWIIGYVACWRRVRVRVDAVSRS